MVGGVGGRDGLGRGGGAGGELGGGDGGGPARAKATVVGDLNGAEARGDGAAGGVVPRSAAAGTVMDSGPAMTPTVAVQAGLGVPAGQVLPGAVRDGGVGQGRRRCRGC